MITRTLENGGNMNESERHELQAIQEDVTEIKNTFVEVQKSLKHSQNVTGFQFMFGLGIAGMATGMPLAGCRNIIMGLAAFFIGEAKPLSPYLMPRIKK